MAQRVIQLLRSGRVYTSKKAAMEAVVYPTMTGADGEVRIARYFGDNNKVKDLLCVFHETTDSTSGETNDPGWTYIEDASDIADILSGLNGNINAVAPQEAGDPPTAEDPDKVVTAVLEVDGVVTGVASNITGITLDGYAVGTNAKIADTDSLGGALGKLQGQINAMDLTEVGGQDGDVITTVSEADGKVSATAGALTDVKMTGYTPTTGGSIAEADTIGEAFNKVEESILKNKVSSDDNTVVVAPGAKGDTDLAVNIDGTTIVKNSSGVLKADLKLTQLTSAEVTALSDNNVKEAYKLIYATNSNRTAIGDVIKIYKDSALKEVYLGSDQDTINASTGVITKVPVTDPQSMNFAYQLADGTYSLTKIDVSKFLTESEFGDGLQVSGAGVVSVKKDATSGKVRIADAPASGEDTGLVDVLTVSSDGVKVDNIQAAIDYAVEQSVEVQAQGDEYVGASIDPNNNKKVVVATDVQALTATAGTPGTYNSTTGAQTTAPTNGTLSGTANSLADSSDIASKVKTYVDGAIAIEVARSDAKNTADIYALNATVGSTSVASSKHVAVQVVEEHGVLTGVTVTEDDIASATEVDKIEAAVGLNNDGTFNSFSNTNYLDSTTTIKGAITALDNELGNGLNSVSNTDHSITVEKKANKDQEISLNLDTTTGTNGGLNGYSSSQGAGGSGSNVLKVTENGLYLSEVWDCGTFA